MAELKTVIQLRNDTAANWETNKTKVLKNGEVGIEFQENGKVGLKIGHGEKPWSELDYFASSVPATVYQVELQEGEMDIDGIDRVVGTAELQAGDIAIVKAGIAGDKKAYTSYVYDGTKWEATDGNYRADNVYFDDDITYTVAIGTLAKPSGSAKFAAKGKNVEQVFSSLMAQEANPNKNNPSVSINTQTNFGTFEIGTTKNLVYAASLNAGSYTYGPATGITATSWKAVCDGKTLTTASGTFENVVAEATAKNITITATYGDGAIPVTNLGNPYPAGQIKASSASKTTSNLLGVRYMFWGPMTADTAITSDVVRSLAYNKATGTGNLATFGAGANCKKVVVAVPAGRKITKVIMPSALNADVTALFVKQAAAVPVKGANGYAAANYDIYVYQPASIDSGETYTVTIG